VENDGGDSKIGCDLMRVMPHERIAASKLVDDIVGEAVDDLVGDVVGLTVVDPSRMESGLAVMDSDHVSGSFRSPVMLDGQ
jgi:hypothetical protein